MVGRSILLLILVSLAGCGKNSQYQIASGAVNLPDGPMEVGLMTWIPINQTKGSKVCVSIESGRYEIGKDLKLVAGEYRVEILGVSPEIRAMAKAKKTGFAGGGLHHADTHAREPFRDVDPQFNTHSTLIRKIEVGDPNIHDFEVFLVK